MEDKEKKEDCGCGCGGSCGGSIWKKVGIAVLVIVVIGLGWAFATKKINV